MIQSGVLTFGDFVTKSGRNTPYFINTGNYKTGRQMNELGSFYAEMIHETVGDQFDAVFGPAYKGIPLATTVSGALERIYGIDKPFFFNRKEVKDHGEGGQLIGYRPNPDDHIIIIEDVLTSGAAIRETLPLLKEQKVSHMFISVDRCEVGAHSANTAKQEVYNDFGIEVHSIVSVMDVKKYLESNQFDSDLISRMEGYMKKYCVNY